MDLNFGIKVYKLIKRNVGQGEGHFVPLDFIMCVGVYIMCGWMCVRVYCVYFCVCVVACV